MQRPADVYTPSDRPYRGLSELDYPLHDWATVVTHCGRICFKGRKVNLSQVFAGQQVGVRQTDDHVWLVSFMDDDVTGVDPSKLAVRQGFEPWIQLLGRITV